MGANDIQIVRDIDVLGELSRAITEVKKCADCCFDLKSLSILSRIRSENVGKIASLKSHGAMFRCVTEIIKEDLPLCRQLMNDFELFHMLNISGSFIISDSHEYVGYMVSENGMEQLVKINNKSFVESQRFLVDVIFNASLPATQRMKEVIKGTGNQFMETIRDPLRVRTLISDLVRSAVYEIAVLFSTKNSFFLAEQDGILDEIGKASATGIRIRLLVMQDETVKEISNVKLKATYSNVQINYLQQLLTTRITTFIIDQATTLAIEVNDQTTRFFREAVGLSTYSNSDSTVFSNISIFESLWIQSEVDKQNNARQAYFQLFKGFKLKDEVYRRSWTTGNNETK